MILTFRYLDQQINQDLVNFVVKSKCNASINENQEICFDRNYQLILEFMIGEIRNRLISPWKILHCPKEMFEAYQKDLELKRVPFFIELSNGQPDFLVPLNYENSL